VLMPIANGRPGSAQDVPGTADLSGVACPQPALCEAVGTTSAHQGVLVTVSNGRISGAPEPVPGSTALAGVACGSASSCEAVGTNAAGQGVVWPFGSGGPGTAQPVPGTTSLQGVACPGGSACEAAGANSAAPAGGIGVVATITSQGGPPPACTRTITGVHRGALVASSGRLCLTAATQDGPIRVSKGAALVVASSTIRGPLTLARARSAALCESVLNGSLRAHKVTGPVTLGGSAFCGSDTGHGRIVIARSAGRVEVAGLRQHGPVRLSGNTGGVRLTSASIAGPARVAGNTSGKPVVISANTIKGRLSCAANTPAPTDLGQPNHVSGKASGQCARLTTH
jgi:hypothetical protein